MTAPHILVINCGSSSLKFAIINVETENELLSGLAERLGGDDASIKWKLKGDKSQTQLPEPGDHQSALAKILQLIQENQLEESLVAVGHRVVHGGEAFTQSTLIDAQVLSTVEDISKLAPLHNPANIIGIKAAQASFPNLPQVAVFDTAFHQSMPNTAYLYPLPYSLYKESGIRRYGFHGTSHFYVANQAAKLLKKDISQTNVITVHLGNGCSITAVKNGQSVDTSMGLTPLEGLVMGTRSGDIDPGIFNYLISQLNYSSEQVNNLLNKESGLLGLSELSNDCRTLEEAMFNGNEQAKLALDIFCYRLAKYIASFFVAYESLDAIVFTGGIGENSDFIRAQVINQLKLLGLSLDNEANLAARFGASGCISNSNIKALVIPTNEELVIAQDAFKISQQHGDV